MAVRRAMRSVLDELVQDVFVEAYRASKDSAGAFSALAASGRHSCRVPFWKSRARKEAEEGLEGNQSEPVRRSGNPDSG